MRESKYVTEMTNKEYDMLLVKRVYRGKKSSAGSYIYMCDCVCKCGKEHTTHALSVYKGRTTSCGCRRDQYLKNTGKKNVLFKGYEEIRMHFWGGYIRGATERGIEFSISIEYAWNIFIEQNRRCALSGVPIIFGTNNTNINTTASIDRIDRTKGYVEGNIQWVHKTINLMKNVLSDDDFRAWCRKVTEYENQLCNRQRSTPH